MADDVKKKELGYQSGYGPDYNSSYGPGYGPDNDSSYGPGYGPGHGPGHKPDYPGCGPAPGGGMSFHNRIRSLVGSNVIAYWVDGSAIRGSLQEVGTDFVVIQRSANGDREAVYLPLENVAIVGPVRK